MRNPPFHPDRKDISLDRVLQALSDPIRRDIARTAYAEGPRCAGLFRYPIAKSTLSHHLKVLREAGLVQTEIRGTARIISLRREDIDARFPALLDAVQVTTGSAAAAGSAAAGVPAGAAGSAGATRSAGAGVSDRRAVPVGRRG